MDPFPETLNPDTKIRNYFFGPENKPSLFIELSRAHDNFPSVLIRRFERAKAKLENIKVRHIVGGRIEEGVVVWVTDGCRDEINNWIYYTHSIHEQPNPCPVTRRVKRSRTAKIVEFLQWSVNLFPEPHQQLEHSVDHVYFLLEMRVVNLLSIPLEKREELAFQVAQVGMLMLDYEIYLEESAREHYPRLVGLLGGSMMETEVQRCASLLTELMFVLGQIRGYIKYKEDMILNK
jgi:hypothetical protein